MTARWARPVALALIRRGDRILVFAGVDPVKGQTFYRPLGGTIEFGERGEDAVRRELREEIGASTDHAELVGVLENIFEYAGELGHELVLLYEVALPEEEYTEERFEGVQEDGEPIACVWMPLAAFADRGPPLYPDGLLALLSAERPTP